MTLAFGMKRPSTEDSNSLRGFEPPRKALNTGWTSPSQSSTSSTTPSITKADPESLKPIERGQADIVLNLLLRLACQVQVNMYKVCYW